MRARVGSVAAPRKSPRMTNLTSLAVALALCACVDPPDRPAEHRAGLDLRATCGDPPWPPPPFAVVPGTYPGQGLDVCLPADDYAAVDSYGQALRDWAVCAAYVGCRQRGGESSPDGCTR